MTTLKISGGPMVYRGRELAGDVLRSSPKPTKNILVLAIRNGWNCFVSCFVHTSGPEFFYHTPGQRPPHIAAPLCEHGDPGVSRSPSVQYFRDAVVGFVGRCLPRTRNIAASNKTSALVFLKPVLAQHRPHSCFLFFFL